MVYTLRLLIFRWTSLKYSTNFALRDLKQEPNLKA